MRGRGRGLWAFLGGRWGRRNEHDKRSRGSETVRYGNGGIAYSKALPVEQNKRYLITHEIQHREENEG